MTEHVRHGTVVAVDSGMAVVQTENPVGEVRAKGEATVGDRVEVRFEHDPTAGEWHVARVMPACPFGGEPGESPVKWGTYVDEE